MPPPTSGPTIDYRGKAPAVPGPGERVPNFGDVLNTGLGALSLPFNTVGRPLAELQGRAIADVPINTGSSLADLGLKLAALSNPLGWGMGMGGAAAKAFKASQNNPVNMYNTLNTSFEERPTFDKLALSIPYDPLTYAGGLGKLAELPALARVAPELRAADFVINRAPAKALEEVFGGMYKAANSVKSSFNPLATSQRSLIENQAREMSNAITAIEGEGYRSRILPDKLAQPNAVLPMSSPARFTTTANAVQIEKSNWKVLDERLKKLRDPAVRYWAVKASDYGRKAVARLGDEAQLEANRIKIDGLNADEVALGYTPDAILYDIWREKHEGTVRVQQAVADVIGRFDNISATEPIANPIALGPAESKTANYAVRKLLVSMKKEVSDTARWVDNVTKDIGLDETAKREAKFNLYQARNENIAALFQQAQSDLETVYGRPLSTVIAAKPLEAIQRRLNELEAQALGLHGVVGNLPDVGTRSMSLVAREMLPDLERRTTQATRAQTKLFGLLESIFKNMKTSQSATAPSLAKYYPNGTFDVRETMKGIGVENSDALMKYLQDKPLGASVESKDQVYNAMQTIINRWSGSGGDILFDDPLHLVIRHLLQDKLQRYGMGGRMDYLTNLFNTGFGAYREQQLFKPRYFLQNLVSQITANAMHGIDNSRVLANNREAVQKSFRPLNDVLSYYEKENHLVPQELVDTMNDLGLKGLPQDISHGGLTTAYMGAADQGGKAASATEKVSPGIRGALGAVEGLPYYMALGPAGLPFALGHVAWGIWGQPWAARTLRVLTQVMETVSRGAAWNTVLLKHVHDMHPQFLSELEQLMSEAPHVAQGPIQGATGTRTGPLINAATVGPVPTADMQAILGWLQARQGMFSPEDVYNLLNRFGVSNTITNTAVRRWRNIVYEGSQLGVELANHINLTPHLRTNFEEWLRYTSPFVYWSVHALPFFAQHLAEHPVILGLIARMNSDMNKRMQKEGVPSRMTGSVEVPGPGEAFASRITGTPGTKLFVNFLSSLISGSGLGTGNPYGAEEPGVQSLLSLGQEVGLGLGPHVTIPMNALNATLSRSGNDFANQQPVSDIFSTSAPERLIAHALGLHGLDPEQIFKAAANAPVQMAGVEPNDLNQYAVRKRLAEMSLEDTGQAQVPGYIQAMRDPNSPLYQRALADTEKQQDPLSFLQFLLPIGTRTMGPTEGRIRQTQADMRNRVNPALVPLFSSAFNYENPAYGAYAGTQSRDPELAALTGQDASGTAGAMTTRSAPSTRPTAVDPQAILNDYLEWAQYTGIDPKSVWNSGNIAAYIRAKQVQNAQFPKSSSTSSRYYPTGRGYPIFFPGQ